MFTSLGIVRMAKRKVAAAATAATSSSSTAVAPSTGVRIHAAAAASPTSTAASAVETMVPPMSTVGRKRQRSPNAAEDAATAVYSAATSSVSATVGTESSKSRPRREAATKAVKNIRAQVAIESGSESAALSAILGSPAASSSSSNAASGRNSAVVRLSAVGDRSGTVPTSRLAGLASSAVAGLVVRTLDGERPPEQRAWYTGAAPKREADGTLIFAGYPSFRPNLTPQEIMQEGAFGGYYYRPIGSGVTGKVHIDAWREFPADWFAGLNISKRVASTIYDAGVNKYRCKSGQDLREWEESGWITAQDRFGWCQWYCRFYLGRRSEDDERQISRWVGVAGPNGRWTNNLIAKCVAAAAGSSARSSSSSAGSYDDPSVSPVVRQTLHHWGYKLTRVDHDAYARKLGKGQAQGTYGIRKC